MPDISSRYPDLARLYAKQSLSSAPQPKAPSEESEEDESGLVAKYRSVLHAIHDFLTLSQHFGQSIDGQSVIVTPSELAALNAFGAAADPVPEPASLTLLAAGALTFLRRRRRPV